MYRNIFLYLSLLVIGTYWIYSLFFSSSERLPAEFGAGAVLSLIAGKVIVILIILGLLSLQGENLSSLGFSTEGLTGQLLRGLLAGALIWVFIHPFFQQFLKAVFPVSETPINMAAYFSSPSKVAIWLFIGIFGGGFTEELQRTFILTRFRQWLGKPGLIFALLFGSIAFGAAHIYQGLHGAIQAGVTGLFFGLVYLRKGSALEAVTAHAFYDVIGILAGYMMMRGN